MSHIGQIVVMAHFVVVVGDVGGGDEGGVGGAVALLMFVFFKQDFITFVFEVAAAVVVLSFFLTVFRVECKFSLLFEKLLTSVNFTLVFMSFMVCRLRL